MKQSFGKKYWCDCRGRYVNIPQKACGNPQPDLCFVQSNDPALASLHACQLQHDIQPAFQPTSRQTQSE